MGCPAHLDLCITIGDDWVDVLEFVTPDGSPFDLTGRTYRAEIRDTAGVLIAAMAADVVVDEVQLSLDATLTSMIAAGVYAWDLVEVVAGEEQTILAGHVKVRERVTS